eukprot:357855-Chlamydomonas_euryale.AAC.1
MKQAARESTLADYTKLVRRRPHIKLLHVSEAQGCTPPCTCAKVGTPSGLSAFATNTGSHGPPHRL